MVTLASAGPSGAPAAVLHPDQPLPGCWQVFSSWAQDGERGAWLFRPAETRPWALQEPFVQVIYRDDAEQRRASNLGHVLSAARDALSCATFGGEPNDGMRKAASGEQRRAYYAERSIDIERRDWWARKLWVAAGEPAADESYSYDSTPDPGPSPADDQTLSECPPNAIRTVELDPSQEWPREWQPVDYDGKLWAYNRPARWLPLRYRTGARIFTVAGLRSSINASRHHMQTAAWDATHSAQTPASGTTTRKVVSAPARPLSSPPEPGADRVRWLGDQITDLTGYTPAKYSAHARRRLAARQALARVKGYEPASAENDALYFAGASVLLAGLNEYARRVLDDGESTYEEQSDALL